MKTKPELMAELIDKADWLIWNAEDLLTAPKFQEWFEKRTEYTRLRAELSEVKVPTTDEQIEADCAEVMITFRTTEERVAYHAGYYDALAMYSGNAADAVKMPTEEEIQQHICEMRDSETGSPLMDEQTFYEGAKWLKSKMK